jgi:hypothetical protein
MRVSRGRLCHIRIGPVALDLSGGSSLLRCAGGCEVAGGVGSLAAGAGSVDA